MSPPNGERRPRQEAAPTVIPADDITTMVAPAGDIPVPGAAEITKKRIVRFDPDFTVANPCERCGRDTRPKRSTKRFCSTDCRVAASRNEPYVKTEPVECGWPGCAEIIWFPRPDQFFCSPACRAASWRLFGSTRDVLRALNGQPPVASTASAVLALRDGVVSTFGGV